MPFGELAEPTRLVGLVVDKYRTKAVRRYRLNHPLDAGDGWIIAGQVEEFDVFELIRRRFNVAGPLERDLLVGANARPARDGEIDAFEIEVVARIRQDGEWRCTSRLKNGLTGPMCDLYWAMEGG